jgi:hypothetical protein
VVKRQPRTEQQNATPHEVAQLQKSMEGLAVRESGFQSSRLAANEIPEDDGDSSGWETASQIDEDTLAAVRPPDLDRYMIWKRVYLSRHSCSE